MIDDEDNILLSLQEELARDIPTVAQVLQSLREELDDPEISAFRNLRHMTAEQWDTFNPHTGMFEIPQDGSDDIDSTHPTQQLLKKNLMFMAYQSHYILLFTS